MDVNLQIFVDGEKLVLRLKNTSEEVGAEIVRNFFQVAQVASPDEYDIPVTVAPVTAPDPEQKVDAAVKIINKDPEFWTTGIKTDSDGTKRYRCRYWCECGNQGNHYIPLGTEEVSCHKCEYVIAVDSAGKEDSEGVPARDSFGNYFLARAWQHDRRKR